MNCILSAEDEDKFSTLEYTENYILENFQEVSSDDRLCKVDDRGIINENVLSDVEAVLFTLEVQ